MVENEEPDGEDLLALQPMQEGGAAEDVETPAGVPEGESLPEAESESPKGPDDPLRRLVRLGWAMVAVLVIIAVLIVAGMLRISNAVNSVACIQKAQANYVATTGPGANSYEISLARLAVKISMSKCGQ